MFISKSFIFVAILSLALIPINPVLADITKGIWTIAAPAPTQRTEVAAAAIEGKIYVVGGFN
ncbi:MAG: galactose oxidase, partial [Nitrosomonas sp.]|nr:galactose oxidase [Nitrosomonas sp.]